MRLEFAHVCIRTRDLDASENFYVGVLGLERVFGFRRDGKECGFYLRISGSHFLEVFEDRDVENLPSTIAHLCLQTDDIDQALAELRSHGVQTSEKKLGADRSYQIWFKDPNGIDIELHQYTEKSSQLTGEDVSLG